MEDRRAKLKTWVRQKPWISNIAQWALDPAFTPRYLVCRWVESVPGLVLNFGAGSRSYGARVVNLDVEPAMGVQVVNQSGGVPFKTGTFNGVLMEYVLEHVPDVSPLLSEVYRILKPGAQVLITVPFKQNFHACPNDYWRFTEQGIRLVLQRLGFEQIEVKVYGGPVSAWINATKEFLATILSLGIPLFYDILSQLLILPFIPLRYADILLRHLPVAKYTAFSFIIRASKKGVFSAGNEVNWAENIMPDPRYSVRKDGDIYWVVPIVRELA